MDLSLWSSIVRWVSAANADWTTFGQHDPGITFVQVFTFLSEAVATFLRTPLP